MEELKDLKYSKEKAIEFLEQKYSNYKVFFSCHPRTKYITSLYGIRERYLKVLIEKDSVWGEVK